MCIVDKPLGFNPKNIKKYLQISLWKRSFCDFAVRHEIYVLISNLITVFTVNLKVKVLIRDQIHKKNVNLLIQCF